MTTFPLIYKNHSTQQEKKFRKLGLHKYESSDGLTIGRNALLRRFLFIQDERTNEKFITTPNGFRVRVKR